ncbi:ubiquilin [Cryptococcus bacillisporus CA1873]|uniref:Ubiquilin n=1 Tax=Cryptococcus bacillisporus CA1873 TaxID=1296111 RepID=A0ABR5B4P9_CRYGA|nr:ubiquilin [Cryptococcus bacillisporus CA1873]|eukprot:KIR58563.1 ubiquilin [Cryptococcus gattii CA1873]
MAAEQPSSASSDITITVKGPQELKLAISISPDKNVAELKELIASKCDVEKDRQRLIYSGKVLKDEETISSYKIQNGHTIHMVKGAAKPSSSTPAGQASQPPRLPQMGTGLNVGSNPIDNVENIHHGLAGFNPFTGVQGLENLNDPNAMSNMMQSPEFLRSMSDLMSRPEVVDQIIASNPQLASMGPQIRQMMASPFFRQMMSNPETLRMMMQMQSSMGQGGGLGGFGGFNPFAPAAAGANTNTAPNNAGAGPTDPFPNLFAPNAGNTNPAAGAGNTAADQATNAPPPNPSQPNAGQFPPGLAALLGLGGGMPGAGTSAAGTNPNPFGGLNPALFGGAGSLWGAPPVRDERPPEEIYATQLGQLNAMGLWDAQKNIRALRTTGGNVEAAIELIFSGQLDQA